MDTFNEQKLSNFFSCEKCHYITSRKMNYDRHILTDKHKRIHNGFKMIEFLEQNEQNEQTYICDNCNKEYKDRTGLWRHKKKCVLEKTLDISKKSELEKKDELIDYLIKENKEIKELILELAKKDTYNQSINHTNSYNKSFNLNFFLNETCKDAMNIMDFVDSIKLQLSDLERVGELGYVEGISSIIVKNLKELDVTKRPVHCTDKKRETIYIKDDNQWEKDDEKKKMHKLVRKVADKNARMIPKYKEVHPDYGKSSSKCSDQYNKIIVESFGNDYEKEEKIIKKVSKEVIIEKDENTT
jgi:hypothetical protein